MAFAYQDSDVHLRYDRGRALTVDEIRALIDALRQHALHPVSLIVDLGCGTGRFTAALAETFDATVLGVEPAANMRAAAEAKPHPAAVRFVEGSAESIPLDDGVAELVFVSQVLHHVPDRPTAFREIHRVLRPGGGLCVRQTTRENLDSYFYQRFFPAARAVDERRLPARIEILNLASRCHYDVVAVQTVPCDIGTTNFEYVERIALRAYSDLESIPDDAFRAGLNALRAHCAAHPDHPSCAELDLFMLAKG